MTNYPHKVARNDPTKKGQLAGKKVFYCGSRFAVYPVHTRFDAVTWFVADAEIPDEVTGNPAIVGQSDTFAEADERARFLGDMHEKEIVW